MQSAPAVAVLVVSGTTLLRIWQDQGADRPTATMRVIVGGFLLGAILTLVGMADRGIATGLAVLISVAAVLVNMTAITNAINAATRG